MKSAAISGGCGDCIYAIPVLRALGVTRVYLKENNYGPVTLYDTMKPLMEHQGFEVLPTAGGYDPGTFEPGLQFDYNIDKFRTLAGRGSIHIMSRMAQYFGVHISYKPWLTGFDVCDRGYSVVHVTDRWGGMKKDWGKIIKGLQGPLCFTGFGEEWVRFMDITKTCNTSQTFSPNMLSLAHFVARAKAVYCNQNPVLALAQGLGKEYWCEFNGGKTNTRLFTDKEHAL